MSKSANTMVFLILFLSTVCCSHCSSVVVEIDGVRVGGWKEIRNVKRNRDIQRLGKFSVDEYNRNKEGGDVDIIFSKVIQAQKQVVSGVKYHLKIAVEDNDLANTFDAVVVVKPWIRSKELVTFAPSTTR